MHKVESPWVVKFGTTDDNSPCDVKINVRRGKIQVGTSKEVMVVHKLIWKDEWVKKASFSGERKGEKYQARSQYVLQMSLTQACSGPQDG